MKGRDWFQYLSNIEREEFKGNVERLTPCTHEEYMEMEYNSFFIFISGAFPWSQTPEGGNYWRMISQRNPVVSKYRMDRFKFV